MNSYVDKCCIELYNASVDRNDKHGDYTVLKKEFGDEIPFEKYYIPEYESQEKPDGTDDSEEPDYSDGYDNSDDYPDDDGRFDAWS